MKRSQFLQCAAAAAARCDVCAGAQSDWPSRNIRFVIPFPPGGGGDVIYRTAAEKTEARP